ncbi:hypothetical protein ACT3CD_11045 [Geofilum sp. OHC36d9]|uniref:hypothetical protein n=1 Tax=Geofilum sp. OHC36d9 TaxID=3458413 RepID=UPI004033A208
MTQTITIYVDTESMLKFFGNDSVWGTMDKPFKTDQFCTFDAPDVYWKGRQILSIDENSHYKIKIIESLTKLKLSLLKNSGNTTSPKAELNLSMISESLPTIEDWAGIFDLEKTSYRYSVDGHFYVESDETDSFDLYTAKKMTCANNLQYAILFKIDGTNKIGIIDPLIGNTTESIPPGKVKKL